MTPIEEGRRFDGRKKGVLRRGANRIKSAGRRLNHSTIDRITGTITSVKTSHQVVALTFDDGPHPEFTPQLLDVLGTYDARATFFVKGDAVKRCPGVVAQAAKAGHAIGNHSWSHTPFDKLTSKQRRQEIRSCSREIEPYGVKLFRPPYGNQTRRSRIDTMLAGHDVVTWSITAEDWLPHDPEWIAQKIRDKIKPGSIILLHDAIWVPQVEGADDRKNVIEAVDMVLHDFGHRFRFVTVPELLGHGHPVRRNWFRTSGTSGTSHEVTAV